MIERNLPIRMMSKVIRGFGRGSKDLGIPTANISRENLSCKISFDSLPCGIYWGFARLEEDEKGEDASSSKDVDGEKTGQQSDLFPGGVFNAAISIGYNPCYGNEEKTIEPHLIAPPNHPARAASACQETQFPDLYGASIRLSIVGYLRPELPFEGLDKLVEAIKNDIVKSEALCEKEDDEVTVGEKLWVGSSEDV